MFRFNYDNITVGTCFDDWVKSICTEVNRILSDFATAKINMDYWQPESKDPIPARAMYLDSGPSIFSLGFAEFEYNKYDGHVKKSLALLKLLQVRLIDALWSVEDYREELFILLQQFDPEHKTPDDYIH